MNEAILPSLAKGTGSPDTGVYADLRELMKVEHKVAGFSLLPRQPVHSILAGRHASRLRGRGLNFEEIRRYQTGDDIRNMDWKVTARMRQPHVRVYTEERDRPCLLLIDQRQSMFFGTRRAMKSTVAAEVAALAAWRVFRAGDRVGAIIYNDTECIEFKPHRSRQQIQKILCKVVEFNRKLVAPSPVSPVPGMFNTAMAKAAAAAKHDHLVCTIGDGFGIDDETRKRATQIAAHNDLMALFVYDPMEVDLPNAGQLVFGHGELQLETDTASAKVRDRFAQGFRERQDALDTFCRQRATPRISISTAEDVLAQVSRQLGHRPSPSRVS